MKQFPEVAHATTYSGAPNTLHGDAIAATLASTKTRFAFVAILASLALTVFEGAIRKWIIGVDTSQVSYIVYFSKDIVFVSLFFLPVKKNSSSNLYVFNRWIMLGSFLFLSGALGSSAVAVNPVGGILTIRAAVFLPLLACGVLRRINGISLRSIAWLLAVFTLSNFILGVLQNHLPADNVLNRYASLSTDITELATGVRATGTFAYIAGMGVISVVGVWAGLVLLSLNSNQRDRLGGWVSVVSGFGCSLASVSRSPLLIGALMVLVWIVFNRIGFSSAIRIVITAALLYWTIVMLGLMPTFSELGDELMQRQETAGDSFNDRAFGQFQQAYEALMIAPFGNGLGTEQVAGNYYSSGNTGFTTYETQMPRIIMETGILGIVGFLVICGSTIYCLQLAKKTSTARSDKSILLVTQVFLISMFYTNVIFNHTASSFVWLIFVIVMSGREDLETPVKVKALTRQVNINPLRKKQPLS
jgi:hypothetical protein